MTLTKYELEQKIKHILDYGENWGFMHVQKEIKWRESSIKDRERETTELKIELQAYKKLLSKMKEKLILSKLLIKDRKK